MEPPETGKHIPQSGESEMEEEHNILDPDSDPDWEMRGGLELKTFYRAVENDNKDLFVKVLNSLPQEDVEIFSVLDTVFLDDAVNCLAAVLNGETAGICDINVSAVPFIGDDGQLVPILHKAAFHGAVEITKMCLPVNEAQVNLRIAEVGGMEEVLPLNLALQGLWVKIENRSFYPPYKLPRHRTSAWISDPVPTEPERLVLKWIFHLCNPCRKRHAEVVRLLASKTSEIEQEILKYVKKRKLFELTALLMFARDNTMLGLEGGRKIRDIVLNEIATLKIFILRSKYDVGGDMLMLEAQKKKMEMEAILLSLEIFDRIGNKIEAYLHYSKEHSKLDRIRQVSWLLKEAGFDAELELLDEIDRRELDSDYFGLILDTPDNNFEGLVTEMSGLANNASGGSDEDNPNHMLFDKAVINNGSKQSTHWLLNKQKMLYTLGLCNNHRFTLLRSYHMDHLLRGRPGFISAMANNVCRSYFSFQSIQHAYYFERANGLDYTASDKPNNGTVLKLQLKNQYQDSDKFARRRTGVCPLASNLQFNRGWILPVNLSRPILWITNKLGRVL